MPDSLSLGHRRGGGSRAHVHVDGRRRAATDVNVNVDVNVDVNADVNVDVDVNETRQR